MLFLYGDASEHGLWTVYILRIAEKRVNSGRYKRRLGSKEDIAHIGYIQEAEHLQVKCLSGWQ